ncbi:MAG: glutamate--tRNA ligase [Alphaproteobacteria bacterium]|nr:glutamate--tRNA ligase [Alphaproteobacteria bacterium]
MSSVAVRFAPSPTGRLHVGNVRPALLNWLFARRHRGTFLLRLDDTDVERSSEDFARGIEENLCWLGLTWDRFARQSERMDRYAEAFRRLRADERLYPCYETDAELAAKRRAQRSRGRPPIYDRAALKLSEAERASFEGEGRQPYWRFRLDAGDVAWDDAIRGPQHFEGGNLSDPVLFRADGRPTYTLASVVDDVDLAITHVIRGEDHVANTAVQIQIAMALGAERPITYAHHPLLIDAGGEALSKRLGSLSLATLREQGIEPMAIASLLARIGTADPLVARADMADLVAGFDLARVGRAPVRFDRHELEQVNARVLAELPFARVAERLRSQGIAGSEEFWNAVRANLATLSDAKAWWDVVSGDIAPVAEDPGFAAAATMLLPPEPWNDATWSTWTKAVSAATGAKGKALFRPLRLALTGLDHGPEMRALLPLIGRARTAARLAGKTAR